MSVTEILFPIGFPFWFPLLVAVGVAVAVIDASPAEFWAARVCFIAAALYAAAFAIYFFWTGSALTLAKTIGISLAGAAVLLLLLVSLFWVDYREFRVSTRLKPGNDPIRAIISAQALGQNGLAVIFGPNVSISHSFPHNIIVLGDTPVLSIDKDKSGKGLLLTSMKIFDEKNEIVARISNNEFWVAPNSRRERPDSQTLIVYDRADNEVLNLRLINPKVLILRALFRREGIVAVKITDGDAFIGGLNIKGVTFLDNAADITVGAPPDAKK